MDIQLEHHQSVQVIKLSGRWDAFSASVFEDFFADLVKRENPRWAVLDLSGVDYISSFGLRGLLNMGKTLEQAGGLLHVAAMQPEVKRIFSGIGFESLFPSFPDVPGALAAFEI